MEDYAFAVVAGTNEGKVRGSRFGEFVAKLLEQLLAAKHGCVWLE
jgi:hypothetical protein